MSVTPQVKKTGSLTCVSMLSGASEVPAAHTVFRQLQDTAHGLKLQTDKMLTAEELAYSVLASLCGSISGADGRLDSG